MQDWTYSPTAVTVPQLILDPYRCGFDAQTALNGAQTGAQWGDEDWCVPSQARTEEEAPQAANLIARTFDVIEISGPLLCRGASRNVRIYAEVRLPQPAE